MVKGYLAGTRGEHHHQARGGEVVHNGMKSNSRSKKPSRDSDTDDVHSSSSMKSGKACWNINLYRAGYVMSLYL